MAGNLRNYQPDSRMLLGKQPARTLIVDVTYPLAAQSQVVDNLIEALENLFSVTCCVGGPSRIPLFSLVSVTNYPDVLLPLSHVKNNYVRIQTALQDLKGTCYDNSQRQLQPERGVITQGLQEACGQFRRQNQVSSGFCHQLEVIIITCQSGAMVQKQIEDVSSTLDLENLKRIQVISLSAMTDVGQWDDADQTSSQNSLMSNTSNNSSVTTAGLTDIVTLDTDPLALQNFFSTWLLDGATDSEHLHLILPPGVQGSASLTVKCDLHDRILNPAQLPFYSQFTVHPDSMTMKTFPTTSKALGMALPVYKINVTNLVPVANFCDSVVFGVPMVVQATSCWKIDWDELEKNQQIFKALCQSLLDKDLAMVGQLEYTQPKKQGSKDQTEEKPQGCFVFLAAPNGSLLVKSIAVRELLMPCQSISGLDGYTEDTVNTVTSSLRQLEILDTFNPLLWSSNLYECLKLKQRKSNPIQQKRKTDQSSSSKPHGNYGDAMEVSGPVKFTNYTSSDLKRTSNPFQQAGYPRSVKRTNERPTLPFPTDL